MAFKINEDEIGPEDADAYKNRVQEALQQVIHARRPLCGCFHVPDKRVINRTEATQVDAQIEELSHNDMIDLVPHIRIKMLGLALYLENAGQDVNNQLKANCYILSGAGYHHIERKVTGNDEVRAFVATNKDAIVQAALMLHTGNKNHVGVTAEQYTEILLRSFSVTSNEITPSPMREAKEEQEVGLPKTYDLN